MSRMNVAPSAILGPGLCSFSKFFRKIPDNIDLCERLKNLSCVKNGVCTVLAVLLQNCHVPIWQSYRQGTGRQACTMHWSYSIRQRTQTLYRKQTLLVTRLLCRRSGLRFQTRARNLPLLQNVQTSAGIHQSRLIFNGYRDNFPGSKSVGS